MQHTVKRFVRIFLTAVLFLGFGVGALFLSGLCLLAYFIPFLRRGVLQGVLRPLYQLFLCVAHALRIFRVDISRDARVRLAHLQGKIVVANHLTLIDVVILIALLPHTTCVAKARATRNPFYGWIVRTLFLPNDQPEVLIQTSQKILSQGMNLLIFPEGTRATNASHALHRGAAQLALRAQAPIVPIFLTCSPLVLTHQTKWYEVGEQEIRFSIHVREEIALPNTPCSLHQKAYQLTQTMKAYLTA